MKINDLKLLIKTKTFKVLLFLSALWLIGFIVFLTVIDPNNNNKQPGDPKNFICDFIWLFYWRWNLDYLMIPLWFVVVLTEAILFRVLQNKLKKETLSVYVSPILNLGFAFLYMLAIDLGVTYFADTGFDGNWTSDEIIWFGFTAQQLYHNFFFWLIPIVIFCTGLNQIMIYKNSLTRYFRAWCIMMAVYSLNLGLLDPIVCSILWDDWSIFGNWAMGGADPIWAEGWIAHYAIFALLWIWASFLLKKMHKELIELKENKT